MSDLASSKQQLLQVEAALLTNPDDVALKQLALDLNEVIALQTQLSNATSTAEKGDLTSVGDWSVGDVCEAVWEQDGILCPSRCCLVVFVFRLFGCFFGWLWLCLKKVFSIYSAKIFLSLILSFLLSFSLHLLLVCLLVLFHYHQR
eukprot:m.15208 g.15208  ORF g.15208 m.15208 type:complete len:146 (-) comp7824_c0_seq4:865-1302(-)